MIILTKKENEKYLKENKSDIYKIIDIKINNKDYILTNVKQTYGDTIYCHLINEYSPEALNYILNFDDDDLKNQLQKLNKLNINYSDYLILEPEKVLQVFKILTSLGTSQDNIFNTHRTFNKTDIVEMFKNNFSYFKDRYTGKQFKQLCSELNFDKKLSIDDWFPITMLCNVEYPEVFDIDFTESQYETYYRGNTYKLSQKYSKDKIIETIEKIKLFDISIYDENFPKNKVSIVLESLLSAYKLGYQYGNKKYKKTDDYKLIKNIFSTIINNLAKKENKSINEIIDKLNKDYRHNILNSFEKFIGDNIQSLFSDVINVDDALKNNYSFMSDEIYRNIKVNNPFALNNILKKSNKNFNQYSDDELSIIINLLVTEGKKTFNEHLEYFSGLKSDYYFSNRLSSFVISHLVVPMLYDKKHADTKGICIKDDDQYKITNEKLTELKEYRRNLIKKVMTQYFDAYKVSNKNYRNNLRKLLATRTEYGSYRGYWGANVKYWDNDELCRLIFGCLLDTDLNEEDKNEFFNFLLENVSDCAALFAGMDENKFTAEMQSTMLAKTLSN